jgi:nicotinamide-nucleotide amidase
MIFYGYYNVELNIMSTQLYNLAKRAGSILKEKNLFIVTAESCTGGLLAATLTDVPGSSGCFERGFVTYSNEAKQEDLGVKIETLEEFGAVSEQVAKEMAEGALRNSHAQIGVAVTGIAGPDGGSEDKPVGTVCIAWARLGELTKTTRLHFDGDRDSIKKKTVGCVLEELLKL